MEPGARLDAQSAFRPLQLSGLRLRNRVVKAATYEGMVTAEGLPSACLLRHHRDLARGGVGMTTLAYASVSADGRTFERQLVMRPEAVAPLRAIADAVHAEGAAIAIQLGHAGGFSKNVALRGRRGPLGPSLGFNAYGSLSGMPVTFPMREDDMARTRADFVRAARLAREAGFDAVELHFGHGYLLSQFLSPKLNRRKDAYGGSLENRLRFPRSVLEAVREALGPSGVVLCKTNLDDGVPDGLHVEEAVQIAKALEQSGASALVLSGGLVSHSSMYLLRGERPLRQMIEVEKSVAQKAALALFGPMLVRPFPFEPTFFFEQARLVRRAVSLPLALLGGVTSLDDLGRAMAAGFELVQIGRALLHDPELVRRLEAGEVTRSGCEPCNACITEMDRPGGVSCAKVEAQLRRRDEEVRAGLHLQLAGATPTRG